MKYQTAVRLCELQAARLFLSEDESRYVLTGIYVEITNGQTLLIGTDGRRLAVIQSQCKRISQLVETSVAFIIPPAVLSRLQWVTRCALDEDDTEDVFGRDHEWNHVQIDFDDETHRVRLTHCGPKYTLESEAIEGNYPSWRKVIPRDRPEQPVATWRALNAEYLGSFGQAVGLLEGTFKTVRMQFHGATDSVPGPMEIQNPAVPYFYGVLMGCKIDGEPQTLPLPDWLKLKPIEAHKEETK